LLKRKAGQIRVKAAEGDARLVFDLHPAPFVLPTSRLVRAARYVRAWSEHGFYTVLLPMAMHPIRYEAVDPPRGPQPYPSMDEPRDLITAIVQPLDTETVLSQPTRTSSAPVTMSWIGQSLGATGGQSSDDLPPECVLSLLNPRTSTLRHYYTGTRPPVRLPACSSIHSRHAGPTR
jgi:hypothetical protein